jgi:hypothetical protein
MRERGVDRTDITAALTNPERIVHLENDKFLCYHAIGDRNVAIVFLKRRDHYTIITVYYANHL